MNFSKRFIIIIITFLAFNDFGFSQDLIIDQSGKKFFCKIIYVDSVKIKFEQVINKKNTQDSIEKKNVARFILSTPITSRKYQDSIGKLPREIVSFYFSYGRSFPVFDFGGDDAGNKNSGLAMSGSSFCFRINFKVNKHFGFCYDYFSIVNKVNSEAVIRFYESKTTVNNINYSVSNWVAKGSQIGLVVSLQPKKLKRMDVDLWYSMGYPVFTLPYQNLFVSNQFGAFSFSSQENHKRSICITSGVALRYKISKFIQINLISDMIYSNVKFSEILKSNNVFGNYTSEYIQKISTINLRLGLGIYMFNKKRKTKIRSK